MTITLNSYANGDTNYVAKLNADNTALAAAINALQTALGTLGGGGASGQFLNALFGPSTAIIGNTSYTEGTAGSIITIAGGYVWRPDLGNVLSKVGSTAIDFTGQSAATYYINVGADGTPSRAGSSDASTLYSVVWTGSAFGTITPVAATIPNGDVVGTYQSLTIIAGAVTLAKMANLAANSVIGNLTGSPATPVAVPAGSANGVATLDSGGKVPLAQLPAAIVGALQYQGTWNANTNSPALASSTGTKGFFYKVSNAGTTTLDGISDWQVGDLAVFDGTVWDKVHGTSGEVLSVAGLVDVITASALRTALGLAAIATSGSDADITYANRSANVVHAGPTSGGAAAPTWRALVAADMPSAPSIATPAFASTLTVDLSTIKDGGIVRVTLTGAITIQLSNGTDGQKFILELTQDGTGSRTVTLSGTYFRFGTDITSFTATTTASKTDRIGCIYVSANSKADVLAVQHGF